MPRFWTKDPSPAPPRGTPRATAKSRPTPAETAAYESALNQFRVGKYSDAAAAFDAFLKKYPNAPERLRVAAWRQLEILRTVHSFDPCLACAVHLLDGTGTEIVRVKAL